MTNVYFIASQKQKFSRKTTKSIKKTMVADINTKENIKILR